MKNRNFYVLIMMIVPAFSFAQGFVIKGKVPGIISGYARIDAHKHEGEEVHHDEFPEKVRIVNGEFELRGKVEEPDMIDLFISTKKVRLILENTSYTIETPFSELNETSVKGGELQGSFVQFMRSGKGYPEYVTNNPGDIFSAYLLIKYFGTEPNTMREKYAILSPTVKSSFWGRKVKAFLDNEDKMALTGKPVPAVVLTGPDGKEFSWDRFKGKFLVVDFWASWCGPCRAFIPTLTETYKTFAPKGIEFISVSVDHDLEKWKTAMEEEKMPWYQAVGQHGFTDKGLKTPFRFHSIPYMVVIAPDGKVAAEIDFYKKSTLNSLLERLLAENK
ncbi:MAG: thioredoxin-like domain-containing protein [Pseudobacter sp.]|uniref:thioredoxin-like domain-containing protein n=1 Tax=Pseudobacter sp. TaxID=2045420 RepID=UPI003F7F7B8F